jgi:hypothetical protein
MTGLADLVLSTMWDSCHSFALYSPLALTQISIDKGTRI